MPEDDICAITLHINRKLICTISSYWGFAQCIKPTQDRIREMLKQYQHCVILGDPNAHHSHWDSMMRPNQRGKKVVELRKESKLTVLNSPNLHTAHNQHQNKKDTTIDLALATEAITTRDFISIQIADPPVDGKHYHSPLIIHLKTSIADHPITSQKILAKCNWEKFREKMKQTCHKLGPLQGSEPEEEIDNYIANFSKATAKHLWDNCPTKKHHHGLHRVSAELLLKIKLKHNLQRQARDHPNIPQIRTQLNTIRKEISQELTQEKDS